MVGEAIPIDASGGAPAYTAAEWRQAQSALLMNGTADTFGARPGRRPGSGLITTAPTATTWSVSPGAYVAMPNFAGGQGPYLCQFSTAQTGTINAQVANPRVDIIQIIVDDASAGDGSGARQARVVYKAGTASGTPVAPALDPRANLLATINVPATGGGSPTVTQGPYAVGAGGVLPVTNAAERTAIAIPYAGMYVHEVSTGRLYVYNGSSWSLVSLGDGKAMVSGSAVVTTNGSGGFVASFGVTFAANPVVTANSGDFNAFEGTFGNNVPSTTGYNAVATNAGGGRPNSATLRVDWQAHGPI